MAKQLIGIDVGNGEISIYSQGKMAVKAIPVNITDSKGNTDADKFGQYIRNMMKEAGMSGRDVAAVLPEEAAYFRTLVLQPMTDAELRLNLPYEFRDYVGDNGNEYFYDYAMNDVSYTEDGIPVDMELFAAAGSRVSVKLAEDVCKAAGLKLNIAIPREMALVSLFRNALSEGADASKEYCVVEIGYDLTRVYIISNAKILGSKTIELGSAGIRDNSEVTEEDRTALYDRISVEIMKAINFYKYEHQDSEIEDIYFCGTECTDPELRTVIIQSLGVKESSILEIIPKAAEKTEGAYRGIAAIGATL